MASQKARDEIVAAVIASTSPPSFFTNKLKSLGFFPLNCKGKSDFFLSILSPKPGVSFA